MKAEGPFSRSIWLYKTTVLCVTFSRLAAFIQSDTPGNLQGTKQRQGKPKEVLPKDPSLEEGSRDSMHGYTVSVQLTEVSANIWGFDLQKNQNSLFQYILWYCRNTSGRTLCFFRIIWWNYREDSRQNPYQTHKHVYTFSTDFSHYGLEPSRCLVSLLSQTVWLVQHQLCSSLPVIYAALGDWLQAVGSRSRRGTAAVCCRVCGGGCAAPSSCAPAPQH